MLRVDKKTVHNGAPGGGVVGIVTAKISLAFTRPKRFFGRRGRLFEATRPLDPGYPPAPFQSYMPLRSMVLLRRRCRRPTRGFPPGRGRCRSPLSLTVAPVRSSSARAATCLSPPQSLWTGPVVDPLQHQRARTNVPAPFSIALWRSAQSTRRRNVPLPSPIALWAPIPVCRSWSPRLHPHHLRAFDLVPSPPPGGVC